MYAESPSATYLPENEAADLYLSPWHVRWRGNACTLLHDGAEAFPAMLSAIRKAERSVRLETYMFLDDAVGREFSEALIQAADRGVEVKVLYDALGSFGTPSAFFQAMRTHGIKVRPFRPFRFSGILRLNRRDHRKLLIVDREVAFIGGINISSHWAPKGVGQGWRDDLLRIEGPAAAQLERRFASVWRLLGFRLGQVEKLRRHFPLLRPKTPGEVSLCVLSARRSIHRAYLRAIGAARGRVWITASYFVPDRKLVQAMVEAVRRGVEVVLIHNRRSDHWFLQQAGCSFYARLLRAGVRIFEWEDGMLHAKTAVVDGVWGTVGSFNLERMSLKFNHEANVFFTDRGLAEKLERGFVADRARCKEVSSKRWARRSPWHRFLEGICRAFFAFF